MVIKQKVKPILRKNVGAWLYILYLKISRHILFKLYVVCWWVGSSLRKSVGNVV